MDNIRMAPSNKYARFSAAMDSIAQTADYRFWDDPCRNVRIAEGRAHPLIVTGLMALAQGHDIDVISERIEALWL